MVALVSAGFTSGPAVMVMLSLAPAAEVAEVAAVALAVPVVVNSPFWRTVLSSVMIAKKYFVPGDRLLSVTLWSRSPPGWADFSSSLLASVPYLTIVAARPLVVQ